MHLARRRREPEPGVAKAVRFDFVTLAFDIEPSFLAHQFREVEGDETGVVRDKSHAVQGLQFHQRHRPAAHFVNYFNPARRGRGKQGRRTQTQLEQAKRRPASQSVQGRCVCSCHGFLLPSPRLCNFSNFTSAETVAGGGLGWVRQPRQKPKP